MKGEGNKPQNIVANGWVFASAKPKPRLLTFRSWCTEGTKRILPGGQGRWTRSRGSVIVTAGVSKKEYNEKKVSEEFEAIMEHRGLYCCKSDEEKISVCDGASGYVKYAMPITAEGDIIGCIAMISTDDHAMSDTESAECKLIQTASSFLGKQFEG